jgi:hypothetical protein
MKKLNFKLDGIRERLIEDQMKKVVEKWIWDLRSLCTVIGNREWRRAFMFFR